MTGWRLGAAVGPAPIVDVIAKLNVNDESCSNHFVQYGALEGLTGDQSGPARDRPHPQGAPRRLRRPAEPDPRRLLLHARGDLLPVPQRHGAHGAQGLASYDELRRAALEETGVSFCTRLHFGRALPGEKELLRALRLLRHHGAPDRGGPRQAEGVGRGMSEQAQPTSRAQAHAAPRPARGARRPHGRLRRLGDAGPVPHGHHRRAPGHAQRGGPLRRQPHGALRPPRPRRRALPPARAHQQRRGARPAAGPVHDRAHAHRRRRRRCLPLPLRGGRVPARRQRRQPGEGLGALPRPPPRASRTWSSPTRPARSRCWPCRARRLGSILAGLIETGGLPEPFRNELSIATLRVPDPDGGAALAVETRIGRTGYTGEPICFELFVAARAAGRPSGTRSSPRAPRPSVSAPATRCVSRPACRCTATSWASTPRATRSPS